MQPQYHIHKGEKSFKNARKAKPFNPAIDPPNSTDFFKEMNKYGLKMVDNGEKLRLSGALTSEMQQRGVPYISLSDNMEYKTLYGEKNPSTTLQSRDDYNHLYSSYIFKHHVKRSSKYVRGGIRML